MNTYEKQSKKIAWICTISIHILLLLVFVFFGISSPTEAPKLEFGVAVNYGTSNEGFGEQQNYNQANNHSTENTQQASTQTTIEQTQFIENKVLQTTKIEQTPEKQLTSDDKESPIIDNKISKEIPKEIPKTVPEPVTNTTLTTTNVGTEEGKNKDAGGNNNGNKPGMVGDMGNPNGDINADALLGNGGIGGGASLEMAGWVWDEKPIVQDKSSETGKIVFEIKIDEDGEVISVKNVYSTVSRSVANLYEKAVYDLSFSTTIDNAKRAAVTTGKIVFVLKSK